MAFAAKIVALTPISDGDKQEICHYHQPFAAAAERCLLHLRHTGIFCCFCSLGCIGGQTLIKGTPSFVVMISRKWSYDDGNGKILSDIE